MFSDKKDKKNMEPSASQNRINEGTELKGDIVSSGFFRIDGKVEGSISKPSKVVIGKTGTVTGKLICENADIEGTFNGDLDVTGTLTLKATAHIEGEVIVGKLAVEPGATFNASCSMQGAKKLSTTETSSEEKAHPYDRKQRLKKASEPLK
ncbi:polymer-forming cytoskeletal protein [Rasiella rasia]|uniref:Polymer-forming cytoskeletal protein n=2 Tax=Rasiella rasia TaxID=2744027 RepID=A0A6G6GQE8_9FLAO|nr:polymer-forming cytoskeletal protein [Rasiella rasia]